MEKVFIKNRDGKKVCVVIEQAQNPKGLALLMHGLSGNKNEEQVVNLAQVLAAHSYTVVRFDTTNTYGESEGSFEESTPIGYYNDLVDVITWAKAQAWYTEPYVLGGTSLGGLCITLFAENYPREVKGLILQSPVISGKLLCESPKWQAQLPEWKQTGYRVETSKSHPDVVKKLPYSYVQEILYYDSLSEAFKLTMPVLVMVGEKDQTTPVEHQQVLFAALPGKKEFRVIKDAPHTVRDSEQLMGIRNILDQWVKSTFV